MIVPSFIQMPSAGVPDAAVIQKAVDGSVGLSGLGYYDFETGMEIPESPPAPFVPPVDTSSTSLDYFHSMGLDTYTPDPASVPVATTQNTAVVGSPGQSHQMWQDAMVANLIKTGGQIMNNVTVPAGTLAVRNRDGSTTYYRQPTGNTSNLPVGSLQMGGQLGLTGGISTSTLMLVALGFGAFMLFQQGRRG